MSVVSPHGPLVPLADRLWQVTGSLPRLPMPRNMAIYRLASGGLLVHSAIALDEPGFAALAALGPVEVVVVPSPFHRLDARAYRERFPTAQFLGPRQAMKKIGEVVALDGACEDVLPTLGIVAHRPPGTRGLELAYELPVAGGVALVFCDLLFNLLHLPGFGGVVVRLIGSSGFFGTTRIGRRWLLDDAKVWAAWLAHLGERTDVVVIAVAHGDAVREGCAARLRAAAARFG